METSQENTSTSNNPFVECNLCSVDEDRILVSVSPRRFSLPPPREKKAKMEIKNNNPYPIYFKAGTSNMDAFRPQPNTGRIPPNSKVSVVVQFFNPVTPIRRHEEVVVVTSERPFEHHALYDCSVCPYCCESFEASKHHHQYVCSPQHLVEPGQCQSCSAVKTTLSKESTELKDDFKEVSTKESSREKKYVPSPVKKQDTKEEINCVKEQIPTVLPTSRPSGERSELKNQNICVRNSVSGNNGGLKLEEICLHAVVHRPSAQGCSCNRCFELSSGDKLSEKNIKEVIREIAHVERRMSDPEPPVKARLDHYDTLDRKEVRPSKNIVKSENYKGLGSAEDSKDKYKAQAHIQTRIVKASDAPDSSDTEMSESSGKREKPFKKTKIISEDDFKRKLQKAKFRKHQIQLEEESTTTTTTEPTADSEQPKEEKIVIIAPKKGKKWKILQEKCDTILNMTWANFYLLLVLIVLVVGLGIFCFSEWRTTDCTSFTQPRISCFFQHFGPFPSLDRYL